MTWISLGSLNPTANWQSYDIAAVGSETFRVLQSDTDPYNAAYIAQYFLIQGGIVFPAKKIFPSIEPIMFVLSIPPDFKERGETVRFMMIRRKLPFYPSPWVVELQAYV